MPLIQPSRPATEPPPIEHVTVAAVISPPVPRPPDLPASAVLPSPQQVAAAPVTPPLPSPSSMTYLSSGGLDPPPRLLDDIDPAVPPEAGPRGGVVVLRLFINERGGVDKAEVLSSAPPGLFDASALEAFGNARFSPGYFAGVPVKSQVTFEVKIRGLGSGSAASGRTY
jgi:TonB family protein